MHPWSRARFRLDIALLVAGLALPTPLLQSMPVDVDGDGEIGPLEIMDLSLHWKGQAAPQLWQVNGAGIFYSAGNAGLGGEASAADRFAVSGGDTIGTAIFGSTTKGPHYSHIHYGPKGDWYIRSAATGGKVILQDGGGYVGIGTTVPTFPLTINAFAYGLIHTDGTREVGTYVNASGGWLGTRSDHPLHFFTKDSLPQMTLATSGSLGIGTSAPTGKLDVRSTGQTPAIRAVGGGSGGTALEISSGAIRVPGAGANTATPAFIHVANGANSRFCDLSGCYCYETVIDHPMTNGNPAVILLVTVNSPSSSGHPVFNGVYYDTDVSKWVIDCSGWFCHGQKFNVLVVKP